MIIKTKKKGQGHICPINTKVQYSCCEEDIYTNVDECGCASNFDNYNMQ